jgi:hypothetical protein
MKPTLIGAVVAGGLIAVVLLIFQASGGDAGQGGDSVVAPVADPAEGISDHPEGSDASGEFQGGDPFGGITIGQPDPVALKEQLISLGVDVPEAASTEDLMELMAEHVGDGFIGFVP